MWSYSDLLGFVKGSMTINGDNVDIPPGPYHNYRIHTLREYVSSYPDDELLEYELNGTDSWEWQSTDYWSQLFSRGAGNGKGKGGSHSSNTGAGTRRRYGN
jgi:hypothetical protein